MQTAMDQKSEWYFDGCFAGPAPDAPGAPQKRPDDGPGTPPPEKEGEAQEAPQSVHEAKRKHRWEPTGRKGPDAGAGDGPGPAWDGHRCQFCGREGRRFVGPRGGRRMHVLAEDGAWVDRIPACPVGPPKAVDPLDELRSRLATTESELREARLQLAAARRLGHGHGAGPQPDGSEDAAQVRALLSSLFGEKSDVYSTKDLAAKAVDAVQRLQPLADGGVSARRILFQALGIDGAWGPSAEPVHEAARLVVARLKEAQGAVAASADEAARVRAVLADAAQLDEDCAGMDLPDLAELALVAAANIARAETATVWRPLETRVSETEAALAAERKRTGALLASAHAVPVRRKLPVERPSVTRRFAIGGTDGYVTVGLYDDGRPGEVFLTVDKAGTTLRGVLDAWAIAMSLALQHGVPLADLVAKHKGTHFEPAGPTGEEGGAEGGIPFATSLVDYVARYLEARFLGSK